MSETVLMTRAANRLVPGADLRTRASLSATLVVRLVRWRLGGLWVGGRLTLTDEVVRFAPNGLNRAFNTGALDLCLALAHVDEVTTRWGVLTGIVEVRSAESTLTFRCFGAARAARAVRDAVAEQRR
ncbi:hypothetical protein K8Z61_12850 [Nocardioides sp. TRM66260-LWL]|uniref:hypothetical protein n=1 Tax=Nocardioides sp. TRM66260-LWL TaxID=2874478 RepID=UPI001CC5871C|nr:hypothetical protein [Nocardioides sp. TRM66260-LWL]MBZ5735386.1 hypothetical protein [Nocardioides sp. TRM66260-LWL]